MRRKEAAMPPILPAADEEARDAQLPALRCEREHIGVAEAVEGEPPVKVTLAGRSEEHTSELQSLMRISYAVFCLKKKTDYKTEVHISRNNNRSHHVG